MTRALRFHILDVFADRRFCGNTLAVVEAADALRVEDMQAIAAEFNFSETVFLLEPRDPVHTARLRIFTPRTELPFAGHPTIGAAALIAETRAAEIIARSDVALVLEEEVGAIRCEARRAGGGVYAQFELPAPPKKLGPAPSADALAAALSLTSDEIGLGAHLPSVYSAGAAFVFVPLRSRAALDRARRTEQFTSTVGDALGVYLYTDETVDAGHAVHARMLANGLGFDEDPATGSAAAAFAGVAQEFERPDEGEHEMFIEQGYAMGRPSRITLRMSVVAGRLAHVAVGGCVLRIAEGTLRV